MLHNLAKMTSATTGTGTLTLDSAVSGFLSFNAAGVIDGQIVKYSIRDGANSEVGIGTYTASGTTLSRDIVENSTNAGAKINCSGSQQVMITALKSDFSVGWVPFAYPMGYVGSASLTSTGATVEANGGSVAMPVELQGPMLLGSVSCRLADASLERSWGWDLYVHYANNGLASQNVLTRVAQSNGNDTYTASGNTMRTLAAANAPVLLSPGIYWLVFQCRHATNSSILQLQGLNIFTPNIAQIKTTANPNGSTLDFVAATWTKLTNPRAMRLNGRVFGQTTEF